MNILISTGSFKDVFSSIESCDMVRSLLPESCRTECVPVCDGGEYTLQILQSYFAGLTEKNTRQNIQQNTRQNDRQNSQPVRLLTADGIVNPYGKKVSVPYLAVDDAAYIVSSEILHLGPEEDSYKDPLQLTDYGLGQLIARAIHTGFRDIRLCLGGTSTIGYGIGTAQALGAELYDRSGNLMTEPVMPASYPGISRIVFHPERYAQIRLSVINDGITKASDLDTVNPLKIGKSFENRKSEILREIDIACNHIYELTGLTARDAWSGNGGGIYFGVEPMFRTEYFKGADYFCALFGLEKTMENADLVITGEGRFDNPHLKKIPVVVSELAAKHGKPAVFVCGQIAPEWTERCERISEGIYRCGELKEKYGIDRILSCTEYYESHGIVPSTNIFREYTPLILKERLQKCQICSL